jgi:hypothetical protein
MEPYSLGITDPIGHFLAYVPVALVVLGALIAFFPSVVAQFVAHFWDRRAEREQPHPDEAFAPA